MADGRPDGAGSEIDEVADIPLHRACPIPFASPNVDLLALAYCVANVEVDNVASDNFLDGPADNVPPRNRYDESPCSAAVTEP